MITLRQLEALQSIVQLGTFERAADRLNLTQSTISKRIQELEAATGVVIFDRRQRAGVRLTDKGEHLLAIAGEMLELQHQLMAVQHAKAAPARRLRLGVTELSALTWLPRLVNELRANYPKILIEPRVETTRELHALLNDDLIDVIVVPETDYGPHLASLRLAEVANAWMARPNLVDTASAIPIAALASYPLLTMDSRSGAGQFYNRWLKLEGIKFPHVILCDSLTALVGLTVAGAGVCLLPHECFEPLLGEGKLVLIPTEPQMPPIPYAAIYRTDRPTAFNAEIAGLAATVCDFTRQLQA